MEVGANYPHDGVLREFRGLIVLRTYLSHAKGASPRSYFSFTEAAGALNDSVCHFMRELDWTGCVRLLTAAWVRTCKSKGDKYYRLTIILSDPLFLAVCYEAIWREPENMTSKSVKDTLSKKNPTKAHLGNKPSKSELSFILACKVEIVEPSKIGTGAAAL